MTNKNSDNRKSTNKDLESVSGGLPDWNNRERFREDGSYGRTNSVKNAWWEWHDDHIRYAPWVIDYIKSCNEEYDNTPYDPSKGGY